MHEVLRSSGNVDEAVAIAEALSPGITAAPSLRFALLQLRLMEGLRGGAMDTGGIAKVSADSLQHETWGRSFA